jgi:hypothetical protein
MDDGEVRAEMACDVDDADHEQDAEGDCAPSTDGGFLHLLVEQGF